MNNTNIFFNHSESFHETTIKTNQYLTNVTQVSEKKASLFQNMGVTAALIAGFAGMSLGVLGLDMHHNQENSVVGKVSSTAQDFGNYVARDIHEIAEKIFQNRESGNKNTFKP